MAWTDHTWVTGETITATLLNGLRDNDRFQHDQGTDIASANTITPTIAFHKVTGTTEIRNITNPVGAGPMRLVLWFTGSPLIRHLFGGTGQINLHSYGDYQTQAGEVLVFQYDTVGQTWYEVGARSPIYQACQVYHDSPQTMAAGSYIPVAFNGEDFDTLGIHDPATFNSRFVIAATGRYSVEFYLPIDNGDIEGNQLARIVWHSGASIKYLVYAVAGPRADTALSTNDIEGLDGFLTGRLPSWPFTALDYIEIEYRNRGSGDRIITGRGVGANPAVGPLCHIRRLS